MRRCVWSRNFVNEEAMAHWGLSHQKQTKYFCTWEDTIKMGLKEVVWIDLAQKMERWWDLVNEVMKYGEILL